VPIGDTPDLFATPKQVTVYTWIVALSVATLLISNLASTKMFDFFRTGLVMDGGAVIFPLSYVLGDVIVEIYGFRIARRIMTTTAILSLFAGGIFLLVGQLPPGPGWENQSSYDAILGFAPRIALASFMAFLLGQLLNAYVFVRLKGTEVGGRYLWWRALGSSLVGDFVDSLVFTTIAFFGVLSTVQFWGLVGLAFAMKILGESLLLPVTYAVVGFLRRILHTPTTATVGPTPTIRFANRRGPRGRVPAPGRVYRDHEPANRSGC